MQFQIIYKPDFDLAKRQLVNIYAVVEFNMFPEMKDEFSEVDYPPKKEILIPVKENLDYEGT